MPTFISLPNGTLIDAETIVSVEARDGFESFVENTPAHPPAAVLIYAPDQQFSIHNIVKCRTYEEACDVRDRIVNAIGQISPVTKI